MLLDLYGLNIYICSLLKVGSYQELWGKCWKKILIEIQSENNLINSNI